MQGELQGYYRDTAYDSIKKYGTFICDIYMIKSVKIQVIGKMGECSWPYIVPLTVEPSKPRLCHDDRFLNVWEKDSPFYLERLNDVHWLVNKGTYMVTTLRSRDMTMFECPYSRKNILVYSLGVTY